MAQLNHMMYCSTQSGYSVQKKSGVISQELEGGAPRYRRAIRNSYHSVAVRWVLQEYGYQYLSAFYDEWCKNPSHPFLAKLKLDGPEFKEYQCPFVEDSLQLAQVEGLVFTVTAQLRVKPIINNKMNELLVKAGNENVDLSTLFNPLEQLMNLEIPDVLDQIKGG